MIPLQQLAATVKANKKQFYQLLEKLKKQKKDEVIALFADEHERVFANTDCLQCANCCKTLGPLIKEKDITRISKFLKIKPGEFVHRYLHIDEDGDYVFQTMPCPFLDSQNYCNIYEVRPQACAAYPHTNEKNATVLLSLLMKNVTICPAVAEILLNLVERKNRK